MSTSWGQIPDATKSPEAFLQWIETNLKVNRTIKALHSNGDVWPGMAAIIDVDGKAHPYDISIPSHENKYIGIVEGRDGSGLVRIITHGVLFNATLNWQVGGVYYIGSNSYITTSPPPASPRFVAVGVDSNRILIMPSPPSSGGVTPSGDENIDGGTWNSVYLPSQLIDGGGF